MTDDENKYVNPADDWFAGKEVKEGHKLYAFLLPNTQEDYFLVGPFADYTAMEVWGDVESESNWQSVELPANFVPHLHAPERTGGGTVDVPHDIEELEELQALVEAGPDWNTIERIEIVLMRAMAPDMTVEDE